MMKALGWQDTWELAEQKDDGITRPGRHRRLAGRREQRDADRLYLDERAFCRALFPGDLFRRQRAGHFRPLWRYGRDRDREQEETGMRESGILLPVSSLPSKYGIGCFSAEAYEFVDQLREAGQSCWQILPLGPTGYGDSPYQSFSTFAGNPYFIDLDRLVSCGWLRAEDCAAVSFGENPRFVDYEKMYAERFWLLRQAFRNSHIEENEDFRRFVRENERWLPDYALYMALKKENGEKPWTEWRRDFVSGTPVFSAQKEKNSGRTSVSTNSYNTNSSGSGRSLRLTPTAGNQDHRRYPDLCVAGQRRRLGGTGTVPV